MTCVYCEQWASAKVIKRETDEAIVKKKKKKKKVHSFKPITRLCPVIRKRITSDSPRCKYFVPNRYFYCENYNCRLDLFICLYRRMNKQGFKGWKECKKCRQFETEMRPFMEKYFIEAEPIVRKREKKITRRNKKGVRKITRRKDSKRKITRRKIKKITRRNKSKRKITRRS